MQILHKWRVNGEILEFGAVEAFVYNASKIMGLPGDLLLFRTGLGQRPADGIRTAVLEISTADAMAAHLEAGQLCVFAVVKQQPARLAVGPT